MRSIPTSVLKKFRDAQSPVSIDRELIDPNTLHGFIVDFDDDWLMVQREYDFRLDGWLFLRRSNITNIRSTDTNVFQKLLMEEEGTFSDVDFEQRFPNGGIVELLINLKPHRVVIFEEETEDEGEFSIGFIRGIDGDLVTLNYFSGTAEIDEEPTHIALDKVTSISFDTNYTLHYERHFGRLRAEQMVPKKS